MKSLTTVVILATLLWFLAHLSGCTQQTWPTEKTIVAEREVTVWHGDISWTLEERAVIERSNDLVAQVTGKPRLNIIWNLGPDGDPSSNGYSIVRGVHPGGLCVPGTHSVGIDGMTPYLSALSAHELGHLQGLDHSPNPRSFMFWAPVGMEYP